MKKLHYILMVSCLFLLAACGHAPIKMHVDASPEINLDESGSALPVLVRFYQLSGNEAFESLSFEQLWQADFQAAGKSILAIDEMIIAPGAADEKSRIARNNKAKYIAAVAVFREPDSQGWRSTQILPRRLWFVSVRGKVNLEKDQLQMKLK